MDDINLQSNVNCNSYLLKIYFTNYPYYVTEVSLQNTLKIYDTEVYLLSCCSKI